MAKKTIFDMGANLSRDNYLREIAGLHHEPSPPWYSGETKDGKGLLLISPNMDELYEVAERLSKEQGQVATRSIEYSPVTFSAEFPGPEISLKRYNRWFWQMHIDAMNRHSETLGRDIWRMGRGLVTTNNRGELYPDSWWAFVCMMRANLKTVGVKHYPLPEPSACPFSSDSYQRRCERVASGVDEEVLFD